MSTAPGLIRDTLIWMLKNHKRPWEAKLGAKLRLIYDQINSYYPAITRAEELENRLSNDNSLKANLVEDNRFIYLDPISTGVFALPILTMTCNMERNEAHYYLAIFIKESDSNSIQSLGFRYETPSSTDGDGRHSSHHVQMIRGFEKGKPLYCSPSWLPDREPTFPLIARDPVQLLLSLLVSLYGWPYLARLLTTDFKVHMQPYITSMRDAR